MKRTSLLLAVASLSGCFLDHDRPIGYERDRVVIGPIELKDRVAYIDAARDRVILVDVSEGVPRFRTVGIGRQALFATPAPDARHLMVITRGEEALREGQVDQDPQLWVVDTAALDAAPTTYEIGSPFDRISIAEDSSVAVAYYSEGGFDADSGVFRNPNELAVIDLQRGPAEDNPVLRTVRSFGSAPDGIVLSPPVAIPGAQDPEPRILALALAPNTVTILDARHPTRAEISIRLDRAGGLVRPREVVFAPNSATAYVRSEGARDVLAIRLTFQEPDSTRSTDNDYMASVAELGAGAGPSDVAVYDDAAGRRIVLAATPGRRELAVIDGDTAEFTTIPTGDPIDRILLFGGDEQAGRPPRIALLAALNQRLPRVHLLSLDGIDNELVPIDLRTINLAEQVLDVAAVPERELAMIIHDDDRTVLGLLDVSEGSVAPLQGVGRLDTYDFSAGGRHLVGATAQAARVGFVDLDNLHPFDLRLDDTPAKVFALASGGIYVDHGDPFGRATFLPYAEADRSESFVLSGFLLADFLDERP